MTRRTLGTRTLGLLAGLIALGGLVACNPKFPDGSQLTVARTDSGIRLSWPAAEELDAGQVIDRYRIDVNGATIASLPAATRSCTVSTTTTQKLQIAVTAYDDHDEWSGGWKNGGTLSATTGSGAAFTGALTCTTGSLTAALPATVLEAAISADGRSIAAWNCQPTHCGIEITDRTTGTTTAPAPLADALAWSATRDLRWFGFTSLVPLAPEDTDGLPDAYVWDRVDGSLQLLAGDDLRDALAVRVSADGSTALIGWTGSYGLSSPFMDVEHVDLATGERHRVGVAAHVLPSISADGRYVAHVRPDEWTPGSPKEPVSTTLWLWDRTTLTSTQLTESESWWEMPTSFSGDGSTLTYGASARSVISLGSTGSGTAVMDRLIASGAEVRRPAPAGLIVSQRTSFTSNHRWYTARISGLHLVASDGRSVPVPDARFDREAPITMADDGSSVLFQRTDRTWAIWSPST